VKLNQTNIDKELTDYLRSVNSIELPASQNDILMSIYSLKRKPLGSGPYPDVSLFEASNRILSDIVILFGVQRLLTNPMVGNVRLPFREYEVALGVEGGNDLRATFGGRSLVGEAFNVAQSFFQAKKYSMIKKLRTGEKVDYRLIIFNADAVRDPDYYLQKSEPSMLYLPVDIWVGKRGFIPVSPR
jgi:hypothetical protein